MVAMLLVVCGSGVGCGGGSNNGGGGGGGVEWASCNYKTFFVS